MLNKLKQILRLFYYAVLLSVILSFILSAKHQTFNYTSSQRVVTYSDWNFYETIGEDDELSLDKSENATNSDVIHLATVCGGYNSTREFYILLKSILFYRTNPIHLHLLVDSICYKILTKLFETWQIPDVQTTYYNTSKYTHEVSWIPTHHYSKNFGLLKLLFPSLLREQSNLTKVILLDTDMLMLGNIKELLMEFKHMVKHGSCIGLVENQSDWYLGKQAGTGTIQERLVWPAISRGFNTGLLLLDLVKMEQERWDKIWREISDIELVTRFSTALADQDIFNAVSKVYPHLFHKLPCRLNIQLNEHAKLNETCPTSKRTDQVRVAHWNSPHKFANSNQFSIWYSTFLNWDASLLRRRVSTDDRPSGQDSAVGEQIFAEQSCNEIRPRPSDKLRTYLFFTDLDSTEVADKYDVSLVVHLSVDRLRALDELAAHWRGPISAAVYLSDVETSLFVESLRDSANLSGRKNIGFHLVFREHGFSYPINRLRNIALDQVSTEFVFLVDVDFLPSYNMYEQLKTAIRELSSSVGAQELGKRALVVPAFESPQYRFEFPTSKSELVKQLNLGWVSMFREQIWPRGHAPTDYVRWKLSTREYRVDWRPDYEPFVVLNSNVARFDESFVGFGWNKVEHNMQLAASGYQFWVLPDVFVVHQFHPASYDIVRHRESHKYRTCIRQLKRLFTSQLVAKYPGFFDKLKGAKTSAV